MHIEVIVPGINNTGLLCIEGNMQIHLSVAKQLIFVESNTFFHHDKFPFVTTHRKDNYSYHLSTTRPSNHIFSVILIQNMLD